MDILEKRKMYADKIKSLDYKVNVAVDAYLKNLYSEATAKAEAYRIECQKQVKSDIEKCQRYIAILDEMIAEEGGVPEVAEAVVQPEVQPEEKHVEEAPAVDLQQELHNAAEAFEQAAQRPGMASIEFPKR